MAESGVWVACSMVAVNFFGVPDGMPKVLEAVLVVLTGVLGALSEILTGGFGGVRNVLVGVAMSPEVVFLVLS